MVGVEKTKTLIDLLYTEFKGKCGIVFTLTVKEC